MTNKRGFTLIELIVVIAIIAILAAIVMVNVTRYINKSKVARMDAESDQIYKALQMFNTAYGDYPYSSNCGWYYEYTKEWGAMASPDCTEPVDDNGHKLSEFLGLTWTDYNAKFIASDAYYMYSVYDRGEGEGGEWHATGDICYRIDVYSTTSYYGCKIWGECFSDDETECAANPFSTTSVGSGA